MPSMNNGVKKIRLKLGLSQSAFGRAIGKKPSTVSMYETGERKPDSYTAYAIIDLAKQGGFKASLEDIYPRH